MLLNQAFNTLFSNGFGYEQYLQRSDRHQDRMKLSSTAIENYLQIIDEVLITDANQGLKVLCIAENWCGDCGNGVPVIAKIAEKMTNWKFRIIARDDYEEIVEQYYTTAGRKKIPIIIFADEDGDEIVRWVERPLESYLLLHRLKQKQLPKEKYIEEYTGNPNFRPPIVSQNIANEILYLARKAGLIYQILPKKKKTDQ